MKSWHLGSHQNKVEQTLKQNCVSWSDVSRETALWDAVQKPMFFPRSSLLGRFGSGQLKFTAVLCLTSTSHRFVRSSLGSWLSVHHALLVTALERSTLKESVNKPAICKEHNDGPVDLPHAFICITSQCPLEACECSIFI